MVKNSANSPSNELVKISELVWSKEKYKRSPNAPMWTKHEKTIISLFEGNHLPQKYSDFIFRYREGTLYIKDDKDIPYEEHNIDKEAEEIIWNEIEEEYWERITENLKMTKSDYDEWIDYIYNKLLYFIGDIEIDPIKDRPIINEINLLLQDTIENNFELYEANIGPELMTIANFIRLRKLDNTNIWEDRWVKDSLDRLDISKKSS